MLHWNFINDNFTHYICGFDLLTASSNLVVAYKNSLPWLNGHCKRFPSVQSGWFWLLPGCAGSTSNEAFAGCGSVSLFDLKIISLLRSKSMMKKIWFFVHKQVQKNSFLLENSANCLLQSFGDHAHFLSRKLCCTTGFEQSFCLILWKHLLCRSVFPKT